MYVSTDVYRSGRGRPQQVKAFQKADGRLALFLYVFLHTACFRFELLGLARVRLY